MPLVLIVRSDGAAFISETTYVGGNPLPREGGRRLSPDDLVDGKAVRDWPAGIHTVHKLERGRKHDDS